MQEVNALRLALAPHADPEAAYQMAAYQQHIAPFLGIRTPQRRELLKAFWQEQGRPDAERLPELIRTLWALPEREYHYAAMELAYDLRRQWKGTELPLFEWMIAHKSWWDTVDFIATKLVAEFFLRFPARRDRAHDYILSGNMWLRRTAIIFQNPYKRRTDESFLFSAIRPCLEEREFFIRKAIGWALREYAKTNPVAVRAFADTHALSPLSRREALKHMG
jgi:3-methyladenine DNA glycosylase AlkD